MKKEVDYKVSGGKLIRVEGKIENDILKEIKITGDFFLHPEQGIESIENSLQGRKLRREELEKEIKEVVQRENLQLVGVSEEDFVQAILKLE